MTNTSPKILIAGGAGYIGLVLVNLLLNKGWQVTVFDNLLFGDEFLNPVKDKKNFRLIQGDLRNISEVNRTVKGHDSVVLLAGLVGEPACNLDHQSTIEINYLGSLNLLEASRYHGVKRFIFTSTDSCYGTREGEDLDELSPLKPISLYAELKAKVEAKVLNLLPRNDFHPTVLRLATVYGLSPRTRFDLAVNLLIREVVMKGQAKIFSGEQWRPLVHVKDVAKAFYLTLSANPELVSGQVFNVGSNHQNIQFSELGHLIAAEMPEAKITTIPQPPDLRDYHVNFDKIQKVLGFTPDLEITDGLKEIKTALLSGLISDPYNSHFVNVS